MSTPDPNNTNHNLAAPELTLTRTFSAGRSEVWKAWTTAEGLAAWWWSGWPDTTYEADARVGGQYRIDSHANGVGVKGEYLNVAPYDKLSFTWIWMEDGVDGEVENVTVTFTSTNGGTRVDLKHTGPWTSQEPVDNYRQGWNHVLATFAGIAGEQSVAPTA